MESNISNHKNYIRGRKERGEKAFSAGNQQGTQRVITYNLINHKWGTLRDYTPDAIKFSSDFATLIAILLTDGGISKHRLNSWRIFFANSSPAAIKLFINSLISVFGISKDRIKIRKVLGRYYIAVLTSKEIGKFLIDNFGTFRTLKFNGGNYPKASIPINLLVKTDTIKIFLRTVFSMDGGVKFYPVVNKAGRKWLERNISLACHHPVLRKQYWRLLKLVGIESRNIESDKVIKISKRKNLEKFIKEIGFINGIKTTRHSKYWVGVEKNKVLRIMAESYDNSSKYLSLSRFKIVKI